jgi:hypothetical protein
MVDPWGLQAVGLMAPPTRVNYRVKNIERFKVCRLSSVVRRPLSVVRRLLSVPIEFPRKYISTLH